MRRIILLTLLVVLSRSAVAEIPLSAYPEVKNSENFKIYIVGVGIGLSWANTRLRGRQQPQLYCAPKQSALGADDYLNILQEEIERGPVTIPEAPVELYLMNGLIRTFPCK